MRRVRCPRCSAIIMANGASVTCGACGLAGRVDAPMPAAARSGSAPRGGRHDRAAARGARERDPWTITIDLRKISPTNWSAGAKSFAVIMLLGLVFVAGGVSGVVFERTRNDVADDLDATSNVFGSRASDGTGASTGTPAGGLGSTPALGLDGDGEPASQTGADADPEANGSDPAPQTSGDVWRFSGTGTTTIDLPAAIPSGVYRVTISYYNADGQFLRLQVRNETTAKASVEVSDFGQFTGMMRYVGLDEAGKYALRVSTQNGGDWDLDVKYMGATTSSSNAVAESDKGDKGIGPFRFSGDVEVTFVTAGSLPYEVRAFGADGFLLKDCSFTPGASGGDSGTCAFAAQTIVYFDVEASTHGGTWTLKATQA